MRALTALAALFFIAACQTAPPAGLTEADRAAIDELAASYAGAGQAGDWAAMAELWTEDAVYQIPDAPALTGREAIVADFQSYPAPTDMGVSISASDGGGRWAWARGTWFYTAAATEELPDMRMGGSFLWVLEKQPDGEWLIDTECYNLDAPLQMPPEG